MQKELLLASQSPRRRQLLQALGLPVTFVDIHADETIAAGTPTHLICEVLAERKSAAYTAELQPRQVLVTADTLVVHRDHILGKPHSREEACRMLSALSGDTHEVYTGVCLRTAQSKRLFTERTDVHFRPLQEAQINYYLQHFEYMDKAGAYGIQDWIGMVAVDRIAGCYYNVMGLPLSRLYSELCNL